VSRVPMGGATALEGTGEGVLKERLGVCGVRLAGMRGTSGTSALAMVVCLRLPPLEGREKLEGAVPVPAVFLVTMRGSEALTTGAEANAAALVACKELPIAPCCCIAGFTATIAEPLFTKRSARPPAIGTAVVS